MIKNSEDYEEAQIKIITAMYEAVLGIVQACEPEDITPEHANSLIASRLAQLDINLRKLYYGQCKYDISTGTDREKFKTIHIN